MQLRPVPGEEDWRTCNGCPLHATRRFVVLRREGVTGKYRQQQDPEPEGSRLPHILLLGEAPGEQEDHQRLPFVGDSGRILNFILHRSPRFTFTLTNMVACRPPNNREPTKEEIEACSPRLAELISAIHFDGIIMIGSVAKKFKTKLPSAAILHPAFIARMEYKLHSAKEQIRTIEDYVTNLKKAISERSNRQLPTNSDSNRVSVSKVPHNRKGQR